MQTLNTDKNQTNIVPLFAIGTFGLHLFTLLLLMFHGGMLQQVKRKSVPQFMNDFKRELAQKYNRFELESPEQNVFVIQNISQPEVIADGKWKVEIIAHRLIFSRGDNLGKSIPFNKQILVETKDEITPLPRFSTPLNLAVYRLGEAKMQIYNICDIEDKSCFESKM